MAIGRLPVHVLMTRKTRDRGEEAAVGGESEEGTRRRSAKAAREREWGKMKSVPRDRSALSFKDSAENVRSVGKIGCVGKTGRFFHFRGGTLNIIY